MPRAVPHLAQDRPDARRVPFEASQVQGSLAAPARDFPVARGRQNGRPRARGGQRPKEGDAGLGVAGGRADLQGREPLVRLFFGGRKEKGATNRWTDGNKRAARRGERRTHVCLRVWRKKKRQPSQQPGLLVARRLVEDFMYCMPCC